jgi:hypothetical protein
VPLQRRLIGGATQRYALLTRLSGVLLIAIGILAIVVDLLPVIR